MDVIWRLRERDSEFTADHDRFASVAARVQFITITIRDKSSCDVSISLVDQQSQLMLM